MSASDTAEPRADLSAARGLEAQPPDLLRTSPRSCSPVCVFTTNGHRSPSVRMLPRRSAPTVRCAWSKRGIPPVVASLTHVANSEQRSRVHGPGESFVCTGVRYHGASGDGGATQPPQRRCLAGQRSHAGVADAGRLAVAVPERLGIGAGTRLRMRSGSWRARVSTGRAAHGPHVPARPCPPCRHSMRRWYRRRLHRTRRWRRAASCRRRFWPLLTRRRDQDHSAAQARGVQLRGRPVHHGPRARRRQGLRALLLDQLVAARARLPRNLRQAAGSRLERAACDGAAWRTSCRSRRRTAPFAIRPATIGRSCCWPAASASRR